LEPTTPARNSAPASLLLLALALASSSHAAQQTPPEADQVTAGMYRYRAVVRSVYDGDTITVDVDLGFGVWRHGERIRLYRINTPEVRGPERPQGLVSRDRLRQRIDGREIILETRKDKKGKYGRYLGEIWTLTDAGYININDWLVDEGLAEYREY